MTWLTPLTGVIAAGLAVPSLLMLYFLKLKRRTQSVSSTLLWKRAVQDLQVNAPFRRIRPSWLLLVQLLILAAALFALAQPVLNMASGPGRRYVIMIDNSASMNAIEADGKSRLETAKAQARTLLESLRPRSSFGLGDDSDQAMIIAFGQSSRVLCNFTGDRRQLWSAIDAIEPTDSPTALAEAIKIARALVDQAKASGAADKSVTMELFSDGRIADLGDLAVSGDELRFHRVGVDAANVGLTAMAARRNHQQPDQVEVFATLSNFGPAPVTCDVQLSLDGQVRAVREVSLPAHSVKPRSDKTDPGQAAVTFALSCPQAGVIEVRQLRRDALASDDAAWSVLPPPRNLRALLVTNGNVPLNAALKACPLASYETLSPAQFDALDLDALDHNPRWDIVVLDGHAPPKLPRGQYIVFGPAPPDSGASVTGVVQNQLVVDWRSRHPLLQFVNLGNVFAAKVRQLKLPADAQVLAEFNNAPAVVLVRRVGSSFVLLPFDVLDTNWPFEPSLVLFFCNATSFLGMELAGGDQAMAVGEVITIEQLPADVACRLRGPGGMDESIKVGPTGVLRFAGTSRCGLYNLEIPDQPGRTMAVNLLDESESEITPADMLDTPAASVPAQAQLVGAQREIWPYLAVIALALVLTEWLIYNLKVRL